MNDFLARARHYHEEIRKVLLHEWDPIGVAEVPAAQDEYDSYIGQIYTMLSRHDPRHLLIDHLWEIETVNMGPAGSRRRTEAVVDSLLRLRQTTERD